MNLYKRLAGSYSARICRCEDALVLCPKQSPLVLEIAYNFVAHVATKTKCLDTASLVDNQARLATTSTFCKPAGRLLR
jgi:hypothetical protein